MMVKRHGFRTSVASRAPHAAVFESGDNLGGIDAFIHGLVGSATYTLV
jgi:hypothetical protein